MSGFGTAPAPEPTVTLWLNAATQYAQSSGYTFEPACLADLTAFLDTGAAQLRSSGEEAVAPSQSANVQHLVQLMIEELAAQAPQDKELHEWTLMNAKLKLCPLFPFC
jgi:hypothetical protein